jgi:molybdopterin-containing oxidoreductase family membrane subunit
MSASSTASTASTAAAPIEAGAALPTLPSPAAEVHRFWAVAAFGALLVAIGLGAAHFMEVHGHAVTGMSNQIVWGLPHVVAIFMIVAASGVLNVASVGSVFGQTVYKARAPLSGLLSLALLGGGLFVLMLDLGRPDRIVVAATHYNFKSVFAWNVFLYSGLFAIVAVYLWTLMERRMNRYAKAAGFAAFIWRFVLTTGTGSIFAFLVARQAYASALLAPMFIVLSFAWGLAVFLIVQSAMYAWNGLVLPVAIQRRMTRLLGIFVAAAAYMVLVYHGTQLYATKLHGFERFLLLDGGVYPLLFWLGYAGLGTLWPLTLLLAPSPLGVRGTVLAAALVVLGGFAFLYAFIIGGQAWPLDIFSGYTASSTFMDGQVDAYTPRLPEWLLGLGGLGLAFLVTAVGVRVLRFMPQDDFARFDPAAGQPASTAAAADARKG